MVEGGATAIPGGDAASQDTLCGAPVEVVEYIMEIRLEVRLP